MTKAPSVEEAFLVSYFLPDAVEPICVPSGDRGDMLSAYEFCQPSNLVQVGHLREEDHLI